jgi:hypothetical protein
MLSPVTFEFFMGHFGKRLPTVVLVLANLVPLYAVLQGEWDAGLLIILYWAENLVIGFYSLLKILLAQFSFMALIGNLFMGFFFCLHYGGFVGVHGMFLIEFVQLSEQKLEMGNLTWPGHLVFLEMLMRVVNYLFAHMTPMMMTAFLVLFISHGISFVFNYLLRQEFRYTTAKNMMGSPYGRIVVMHITLIVGAAFAAAMGSPLPLLVVMVLMKIGMDVGLHLRSHKKVEQRAEKALEEASAQK